jgi:predicted amidohydrolase YtcJ
MNAWDDENLVATIKATGREKIVLAGISTETCVALPTIQARYDGYEIYVVEDCCGDVSQLAARQRHAARDPGGRQSCDVGPLHARVGTRLAADFENFCQPRPDMPPEMERELEDVVRILATNRWSWRLHATYDETITVRSTYTTALRVTSP